MLLAIVVLFGGIVGLGHAIGIYYEIKHDQARKRASEQAKTEPRPKQYIGGTNRP